MQIFFKEGMEWIAFSTVILAMVILATLKELCIWIIGVSTYKYYHYKPSSCKVVKGKLC